MSEIVPFQPVAVSAILVIWAVGVRWSPSLVAQAGVRRWGSCLAISAILPTAMLLLAVQILGAISLLTDFRFVRPWWIAAIFTAFLYASHLAMRRLGDDDNLRELPAVRRPVWSWCWCVPVVVLAGTHAVFLIDALSRYPTGYDSVHYHLPAAVSWVQDGALTLPAHSPHFAQAASGDIPAMLLLAGGFEWLVPVVNVPFGLLTALVLFEIAALLGIGVVGRWMVAGLVLSVPMVIYQMYSNYVDLFAASFWLAGLLAVLWATRVSDRRRLLVLAGLAVGIAAGTRTTYWVMAILLGCVVLLIEYWPRADGGHRWRRMIHSILIFAGCGTVCMWFWPLRAFVTMGNPLYPLSRGDGVWLHGGTPLNDIFAGSQSLASLPFGERVLALLALPWREFKFGSGYGYGVEDGTGTAFAMLVPLGLLLAAGTMLRRRRPGGVHRRRWMLMGLVGAGMLLYLTQFRMYTRYSLATILLAVPVAVVGMEWFVRTRPRLTACMATMALLVSGSVAGLQPARDLAGRLRDGNWDRAGFYLTPDFFDVIAPGSVILNSESASETMTYALAGRSLSNRVIDPVQWRRMKVDEDAESWSGRQDVDYVYARGFGDGLPTGIPDGWKLELILDDSDAPLSPGGPTTRVYRVVGKTGLSRGAGLVTGCVTESAGTIVVSCRCPICSVAPWVARLQADIVSCSRHPQGVTLQRSMARRRNGHAPLVTGELHSVALSNGR